MDFIIGVFVFTIVLLLFYHFVPNLERQELDTLTDVYFDARTISFSVADEGYPANWTNATVERIGLLSQDGTLNATKMRQFYNLTVSSYDRSKELFDLSPRTEYVIYFTDRHDNPIAPAGITHIGEPSVGLDGEGRPQVLNEEHEHLVSLTRIFVYNRTTVKAVVYAWA